MLTAFRLYSGDPGDIVSSSAHPAPERCAFSTTLLSPAFELRR